MRCKHCGKMIPDDSVYCLYCRAKTNAVINQVTTVDDGYQGVKCVNCGSHDLQVITEVRGAGVDGNKVCGYGTLGILSGCLCCGVCSPLLGVLGALCGMEGAGETQTDTLWVCKRCGKKFRL